MKQPCLLLSLLLLLACQGGEPADTASASVPDALLPTQDPDAPATAGVDGISVPAGFAVSLFAEGVGRARHLAVRANGDVYVRLQSPQAGHCAVALRDDNGDGQADTITPFDSGECGTGMRATADYLYFSSDTTVYRAPFVNNQLLPGPRETLVENLGDLPSHQARSLALDGKGGLYVNVGAPSNACQVDDRQPGSPGQDPCPLLEAYGGIYRFDAAKAGQDKIRDGQRYATGIRNAVALNWHSDLNQLYLVQHGRDQLNTLYPDLYSAEQNASLPAEEFLQVSQGDDFGWPYCYYDPFAQQRVLAPEYGGDGKSVGRCAQYKAPALDFPAHYAPNDLLFYQGSQFPESYRQGAFIAFHGSWNRQPLQQEGYQVVFAPFAEGKPSGKWRVFADGFAGPGPIQRSGDARYRPMGVAEGPDGSLYVADSKQGRIWRITYPG
ncbi:MAG: PQQ-dependent sugar dehydrogenase [Candidatus Sericytochromatia bacterium]|nr:PQQ-dependent sugar dehydrogenase [Candidatus Sericytochromatia bacterium]